MFCSTKILKKNDQKFFSKEDLFPQGRVTEMYVISAYTDVKIIDWLVEKLRDSRGSRKDKIILKIFLDERFSRFSDENMRQFLLDIGSKIKDAKRDDGRVLFHDESGIYLVRKGSLFHTKLIVTKTAKNKKAIVGSLNFTNKAFESNEELVYVHDGAIFVKQAEKYVRMLEKCFCLMEDDVSDNNERGTRVWKVSPDLSIDNENDESLDAYLASGFLIHPARSRNFPEYFDLKLPEYATESKISNIENADLLDSKSVKKSISVIKMLEKVSQKYKLNLDLKKGTEGRESWSSLCIDTPLGWWCPKEALEDIDSKSKTAQQKIDYHNKIFSAIKSNRRNLLELFLNVQKDIKNFLSGLDNFNECDWEYSSVDVARNAWNDWIDNLIQRSNDAFWMERLNAVVVKARVPSFFDDPMASIAFKRAFIESLEYERTILYGSSIADKIYQKHEKIIEKAKKEIKEYV